MTDARQTALVDRVHQLWTAAIAGDEDAATAVALDAVAAGVDEETVLLDLVGGVQRRVGVEWADGRITVAQEHVITAINDRVIGALRLRRRSHQRPGRARAGRVAVACVDGEWHALPARLVAEVLAVRGFAVEYLGTQIPVPHLIEHLHRTGPSAIAISASIPTRLPAAHATITACAATGTPVLVGGGAFGPDGRYASRLGAQAWAPDARAAADVLAAGPLPRPAVDAPFDDLPHLADQEYTMVARSAAALVRAVYARLPDDGPRAADASIVYREQVGAELRRVVDFLAAALYVDDPELFQGFVSWVAAVAAARDDAPVHPGPVLAALAAELRDFPRAIGMLEAAGADLAAVGPTATTISEIA